MSNKKQCFVISPIGEDGSDIRKRADQVLKHIITPAAQAAGYDPIRADQISEPGLITSQVIQHIVEDPLVIADLTGMNPNVYYELAIRHAIRRPLVQIIHKGDKIPFDVAGMRTVPVDHRDLDSVEEAKEEIQKQIKAVEGKKPEQIESPISVSVELQSLRHSDKPEDRSLAEFVSAMSQLRGDLAAIDKRLSEPEKLIPPNYIRDLIRSATPGTERRSEVFYHELRHLLYTLREELSSKESKLPKEFLMKFDDRIKMLMYEMDRERTRGL